MNRNYYTIYKLVIQNTQIKYTKNPIHIQKYIENKRCIGSRFNILEQGYYTNRELIAKINIYKNINKNRLNFSTPIDPYVI